MKLSEVVDGVILMYKTQCMLRRVNYVDFGNKQYALWLSAGMEKTQRRVLATKNYNDLAVNGTIADYSLITDLNITDFGHDIRVQYNNNDLDRVSAEDIPNPTDPVSGDPTMYAIYSKGTDVRIKFDTPPSTDTLPRLWYYRNTFLYSPSGVSAQSWGTFDGTTFSGDFALEDRYVTAVQHYVLGQIFPEYLGMYEIDIEELKESSANSYTPKTYNIGGF